MFYQPTDFTFDGPGALPLKRRNTLADWAFYDIGNLWDLDDVNTTGGTIVGEDGSFRQVIGLSVFWDTPIGPLRFNFMHALEKEEFDNEQSFDFTLSTQF